MLIRPSLPASSAAAALSVVGAAVVIVNGNAFRDVRIETGEIMVKANWKFGPTLVVAKY
jgi:hypothetical protein